VGKGVRRAVLLSPPGGKLGETLLPNSPKIDTILEGALGALYRVTIPSHTDEGWKQQEV